MDTPGAARSGERERERETGDFKQLPPATSKAPFIAPWRGNDEYAGTMKQIVIEQTRDNSRARNMQ